MNQVTMDRTMEQVDSFRKTVHTKNQKRRLRMKSKKFQKKLSLTKETVTLLKKDEMKVVGGLATFAQDGCSYPYCISPSLGMGNC